jgi:hypothetical protein
MSSVEELRKLKEAVSVVSLQIDQAVATVTELTSIMKGKKEKK